MGRFVWVCSVVLSATVVCAAEPEATSRVLVEVVHDGKPVRDAGVRVGARTARTSEEGRAVLEVPAGTVRVEVTAEGMEPETAEVALPAGDQVRVVVELRPHVERAEEVIVTATRSGKRLQDEAVRVEVLDREEIEEKLLMTPGDVAMLLNETGGLRVQMASPSLGAANVRIQGLRGRYTQILADGLPLYGGQTGSIGLLQIPPMDLGQVEIIKGVASAFYGASALGGVVNLVSRRPPEQGHDRELLLNGTTRKGADGVLWLAGPLSERWAATLLGGAHGQTRQDVDGDGWADLPHYARGLARPRVFWNDGAGKSVFLTVGAMVEARRGGTRPGRTVADGNPFQEALDTDRFDTGVIARFPLGTTRLLSVRASAMSQGHRHEFGETIERDRHQTALAETSMTATSGKHTWVIGAAVQADGYRARDVSGFDYTYTVPGVFVQDDVALGKLATVSASVRFDRHSAFGAFVNPRASALLRPGRWTIRASVGGGYYAPTPFTEETEAVGLTRLAPLGSLRPERASSASLDAGTSAGILELHGTVFASLVRDPIAVCPAGPRRIAIVNAPASTRTAGIEALGRARWRQFVATATYTFTSSTEVDPETRRREEVALTPRHAAGLVAAWEKHGTGRIGLEIYYTGRQRLEDDPYRHMSVPYVVFGMLAERRIGRARLFVNAENLGGVRQTEHDPLVRPVQANDGRWTVDAWAPLEGRTINGGVRLSF
jgi:outer membrane receptor for ferrienterochelin and colicins